MPTGFADAGQNLFQQPLNPQRATVAPVGGQPFSLTDTGQIPLSSAQVQNFILPGPWTAGNTGSLNGANYAHVVPITIPFTATINGIALGITTTGGTPSFDVGIYTTALQALWRRGGHQPTALGNFNLGVKISSGTPTTLTLTAGLYYVAFAADSTFLQYLAASTAIDQPNAVAVCANSYPLPATLVVSATGSFLKPVFSLYGGNPGILLANLNDP